MNSCFPQRSRLTMLCVLGLVAVLGACGGGDENESGPSLAGVWEFTGYGSVVEIKRQAGGWRAVHYETTREACRIGLGQFDLGKDIANRILRLGADGQSVEWVEAGQTLTPGRRGQRVAALPQRCQQGRWLRAGEAGYRPDALREFDWAWASFNELYHDFALSGTRWDQQRNLRGRLTAQSDETALFETLAEMVFPLHDGHAGVFLGERDFALTRKPLLPERAAMLYNELNGLSDPLDPDQETQRAAFVARVLQRMQDAPFAQASQSALKTRANGRLRWWRRDDGLVVVQLLAMGGYVKGEADLTDETPVFVAALDELMADARGARGMLLDLRFNLGGMDEHAVRLASRFAATRTHAYSKQARAGDGRTPLLPVVLDAQGASRFAGPLAVLTSSSTFSAAEVLALSLRSLPQVRLFGERSAGALSDALPRHTGGQLQFTLSNEFYLNPQGEWFESLGVPVHFELPVLDREQLETGRDAVLDRALQWLRTGS